MYKIVFNILTSLLLIISLSVITADAYIDPGTSSALFSSISYVLAGIAAAFGFLIWPLKKLYYHIKNKFQTKEE